MIVKRNTWSRCLKRITLLFNPASRESLFTPQEVESMTKSCITLIVNSFFCCRAALFGASAYDNTWTIHVDRFVKFDKKQNPGIIGAIV